MYLNIDSTVEKYIAISKNMYLISLYCLKIFNYLKKKKKEYTCIKQQHSRQI